MKLHLPKQLFTALLAAITLAAPAAWGNSGLHNNSNFLLGGTGAGSTSQTPYTNITETTPTGGKRTTAVDKIDASSLSEFNIWADSNVNVWTNALVTELRVGNNATIKVSQSYWPDEGGDIRYFDSLHIQNLNIDGGQATLNVTLADHIVTVDAVNGSLSSVSNAGTLTLGAATLSGNVTNSGTLTLGAVTLSGNVTNSGTLTLEAVTLSGDVTYSGTLTIAGTLSGTGELTNSGNGKVKVDTTNFLAFDGLKYTKANGDSNSVKAGFLSAEQTLQVLGEDVTYDGEVYINDSETSTPLTDGAVTTTIGAVDNTFYVNEAWIYNSTDSAGATAFHVGSAGTLKLTQSLGSLSHAAVTGNGRLEIGYNAGTLGAFSEMFTGTLAVVSGGILQMTSGNINGIDNTVVVDGGSLTLTRDGGDLTRSFDVKNGGTLTLGTTDIMDEGAVNTITVTSSTLDVGTKRIASGAGTRYIFNEATVTGAGDGNGALDFSGNATLTSSGASSIEGALRIRSDKTLTLNVSDTLTVGAIVGQNNNSSLTKTGAGTLKIISMAKKNEAFIRGTMAVQAGTVEFALDENVLSADQVYNTFSGAITGSGTFRKSGSAKLTLSGTLGTESARLGTVSATGGELAISGTGYVSTLEISGDADVRVVTGGNLNVTTFNASTGSANTDRNVYIENGATVTAATLNVSWNMGSVAVDGVLNATTELFLASNNRSNTTELLSGAGEIEAAKFRAGNYGSYGVNVATLTIGADGLVVENDTVLNLASATTTVEGTTTVNSGNVLNFNAGSARLDGAVTNDGSINVNGGSATLNGAVTNDGSINVNEASATLNGGISGTGTVALTGGSLALGSGENITNTIAQFNYSGGTLSHSGLTVTNATFSGCTLVNTGALTLNGTLNIVNQEALTQSGEVTYSNGANGFYRGTYYVVQSAENSGASLTTGDSFVLQLAGTAISGTSGNSSSYWSKDEESGNLLLTLQDNAGTYFVNTETVKAGGTGADAGTDQASRFTVADGATLQLQGNPSTSLTAAQALITTTGKGNITLGTDASIAASSVSQATGKLTINSGVKLTMDAGSGSTNDVEHKTYQYNLSSFTSVELDGGTIQYHGAATTLNNVTVTENGAHITFRDMNNANAAMTLAGTTTLNGTLTLNTLSNDTNTAAWKYGVDIARLTGSGTLDIHSTNSSNNTSETARVSIQDLSGFTGEISLSKHVGPAQLNLNNLSGTLGLNTIAMAGGAQTTLSVNENTVATMATVIRGDGTVTKQGAGKLTLSGASSYTGTTTVSAGELALAAGASLGNGAVTVASGATLSMGDTTGATETTHTISTLDAASGSVTLADNATLNLSSGTSSIGTLNSGSGSKINLDANATLNRLSSTTGTVTLTGSGVYDLGSNTSANVSGLTAATWTGTVKITETNFTTGNGGIPLQDLGNSASSIELRGVTAYQPNALTDDTCNSNIILNNGQQGFGLKITDGWAANYNNGITFTGAISGSGKLEFAQRNTSSLNQKYVFTGDISKWTGAIEHDEGGANLGVYLVFDGNASEVNTAITGGVGGLNVEAKTDVTFNQNLTSLSSFVVNNGKTATVKATLKSGTVTNNGILKLGTAATVTGGTMGNVTAQASGISSADTTRATKGSISDANVALAQLAQDASFTIQDMTLTNTTITAATPTTKVSFDNVTVTGATVLKNLQAAMIDPSVTLGGSETDTKGSFTATTSLLSGITLANEDVDGSTLVVDLGDLSCAADTAMGPGKYDLTITLSGFHMQDCDTPGLLFAADSWLGKLLLAQSANAYVSGAVETPASVSAGGGNVSVSYADGGADVGTIITIRGLNVPEPTTATLSLLALAALAARRRRND